LLSSSAEVWPLLEAIATTFEGQHFEISNTYNLATLTVEFAVRIPAICKSESAEFVVSETLQGYFYAGCTEKNQPLVTASV
jgi:hypothetical protein